MVLRVGLDTLNPRRVGWRCAAWSLAVVVFLAGCQQPPRPIEPGPRHTAMVADLAAMIRDEMADKKLSALSIAVLDGDQLVWSQAFGDARPGERARRDTVFRVGSISKLFSATAAMQQVERGSVRLDQPVAEILTSFRPRGTDAERITLRHLLSHHSGLVREPPVGSYFYPADGSLEQSVASLTQTALVALPGERVKYSNAGAAVGGRVVEALAGRPFAAQIQEAILQPLGLASTSFDPPASMRSRTADAVMWTMDGRETPAPKFDLGMVPAANLYSTAEDLVRFAQTWFVGAARDEDRALLNEASLRTMYTRQFTTAASERGIGLGFFVDTLDGRHLRVGHGGAMYGFASQLEALPEEGFAVAVLCNRDFANEAPEQIAERALQWLVAERDGQQPPPRETTEPLGPDRIRELVGRYGSGRFAMDLVAQNGDLWLYPHAGLPQRLRRAGDQIVTDGPFGSGRVLAVRADGVFWNNRLRPRNRTAPRQPSAEAVRLIGEYGPDYNVVYVLERHGELQILIEWFGFYPLQQEDSNRFRLGRSGWYAQEPVVFDVDSLGRPSAVTIGGVRFARRPSADERPFRITPTMPEATLRSQALSAVAPDASGYTKRADLVDLRQVEPELKFDIRYATTDNFLGLRFYEQAKAFLQRPAALALARAHRRLADDGYGILVFDGYRPWSVTKMFWDATPDRYRDFVADPAKGSRHNRGCAVDIGLYDLKSGKPVAMPSGYDEFTPRAFPRYPGGTELQRYRRDLMRSAMSAEGFTVYENEWWHFDFQDWERYPILNVPIR